MLESLKASLFLFFLFFPSILLEKALPPSLLVAPRNSALPYQILSPSNDEEKKRDSFIESFSHYRTWFVRNMVLNTVNQTSDKEREIEKEGISHA